MPKEPLNPATTALHRANQALTVIKEIGPEPRTVEANLRANAAWSDLLTYGNRVFTKLEQAAKASPKGQAWFAEVKKLRKSDAVLRYMQHARNSDEHGLKEVIENNGGTFEASVPQHVIASGQAQIQLHVDADPVANHPDIKIRRTSPPRIVLQPVIDRGVVYEVPDSHGGKALSDSDLAGVGSVFTEYLERFVDEAETKI